jgi:hypothetical protein
MTPSPTTKPGTAPATIITETAAMLSLQESSAHRNIFINELSIVAIQPPPLPYIAKVLAAERIHIISDGSLRSESHSFRCAIASDKNNIHQGSGKLPPVNQLTLIPAEA